MVGIVRLLSNHGIVEIVAVWYSEIIGVPILLIASYSCVSGVLTSHETCATGCADRTACIGLCEAHALIRHAVEIRRGYIRLPIASNVAIAHIIAKYEDYVWTLSILICCMQSYSRAKALMQKVLFVLV